jgi:hypothetical protein
MTLKNGPLEVLSMGNPVDTECCPERRVFSVGHSAKKPGAECKQENSRCNEKTRCTELLTEYRNKNTRRLSLWHSGT